MFSDIAYFNSVGLSRSDEEVFDISVGPHLEAVPGQITMSLSPHDLPEQEGSRFEAFMDQFDFSRFESDSIGVISTTASDTGAWAEWSAACNAPEQSQEVVVAENPEQHIDEVAGQHLSGDMDGMSTPPQHTAVEVYQSAEAPVTAQSTTIPSSLQPQATVPVCLPADFVSGSGFQVAWAQYLQQKEREQSTSSLSAVQAQLHHVGAPPHGEAHPSQPQYSHPSLQQQQQPPQTQSHHSYQQDVPIAQSEVPAFGNDGQQSYFEPAQSVPVVSTQSGSSTVPSVTVNVPTPVDHYVPPSGAHCFANRRVAGSWRLPASQHEEWSAPQTPVEVASASHPSPWAGASN